MKRIKYTVLLLVGLTLFSAFDESRMFKLSKNMQIFAKLYRQLSAAYVDDVAPGQLMKTSLDAMLKSLDPYTNYISGAQIEIARLERGTVGNIGIVTKEMNDRMIITEVLEGMGANLEGIKAGDELLRIDGKRVEGKTAAEIELFLKGQPDSQIDISYIPEGGSGELTKTLTRTLVPAKTVTYHKMYNDSVGYIKLDQFTRQCGLGIMNGIKEMREEGDLKALIFDLRGNPGGLLNEAVFISNLFIPKGREVVSTKGKVPSQDSSLTGKNDPEFPRMPMVLLTNSKSASASEIVSGVMQDYDRGVVMGQRTYGKGLVQQTKDIGFKSKLKVTIAKYYLPTGRCIQAIDYSGKYTDQGAKEIPDSLKQSFQTINSGRTVYDAGGVNPDVIMEKKESDVLVRYLNESNLIFNFVNSFVSQNDSIDGPDTFEVSDEVLASFKSFLEKSDYRYLSSTEKVMDALNNVSREESFSPETTALIQGMKEKVQKELTARFKTKDEEIRKALKSEIVSRYFYQKGKTAASLYDDEEIAAAAALLASPEEYNALLR